MFLQYTVKWKSVIIFNGLHRDEKMLAGEEKLFLSCTSLKVSKATLEKTSGEKELMMDLDWSLNFPKNIFKQKSTLPLLSSLLIRAVGPYKGSRSSSVSSVLQ